MDDPSSPTGRTEEYVEPLTGSEWLSYTAIMCVLHGLRADDIESRLRQAAQQVFGAAPDFEDRFQALYQKVRARFGELTVDPWTLINAELSRRGLDPSARIDDATLVELIVHFGEDPAADVLFEEFIRRHLTDDLLSPEAQDMVARIRARYQARQGEERPS